MDDLVRGHLAKAARLLVGKVGATCNENEWDVVRDAFVDAACLAIIDERWAGVLAEWGDDAAFEMHPKTGNIWREGHR